jgi:transcription initiation factor IIE alpha subunit
VFKQGFTVGESKMPIVTKTGHGQGTNFCMIVASLMHKENTSLGLAAVLGMDKKVVRHNLHTLHDNGLVYRKALATDRELKEDGTYSSGPFPVVWAFNNPPFQHGDFV